MATFPVKYFRFSTRYPESGVRLQLGRSWTYTAGPDAPDQRIFVLTLQGMAYFLDSGGNINASVEPGRNMATLEAFYNEHKLYKKFDFLHPVYGSVECKFNSPLQIPEGVPGGDGLLDDLSVELIEIP